MTHQTATRLLLFSTVAALLLVGAGAAFAQTDPGVRTTAILGISGTTPTTPPPVSSVSSGDGSLQFFQNGLGRFQDQEVVRGGANNGLGPRFNFNQCSGCHSQPAVGGSSPSASVFPFVGPNPESQVVSTGIANGNFNSTPSFITANGPTREARFPFFFDQFGNPDPSSPNGGVETIFTITGRSDAGSCNLGQPSFALAQQTNNVIFRIPTPTFGAGLLENIDDSTILRNLQNNGGGSLGISGALNHNGNDGTISRFGWKAQNKSLEIFAGEAYNVEMGITNELFTQERPLPGEDQFRQGLPSNCLLNPTPEDTTNFTANNSSDPFARNASVPSDTVAFAMFMRLLTPPLQDPNNPGGSASISRGRQLFGAIGCAICHTPSLNVITGSSFTNSLGNTTAQAFSDIAIHHMGDTLHDNVSQGGAGGDQFRTAPLWGVGQRIFFLHDGRCHDLLCAIEAHESNGGEATTVEFNFNNLSTSQQQDLLNFLRSL